MIGHIMGEELLKPSKPLLYENTAQYIQRLLFDQTTYTPKLPLHFGGGFLFKREIFVEESGYYLEGGCTSGIMA